MKTNYLLGVIVLSLFAGCATGPTPAQQREMARKQVEIARTQAQNKAKEEEARDWEEARQGNTTASYAAYLAKHKYGAQSTDAERSQTALARDEAAKRFIVLNATATTKAQTINIGNEVVNGELKADVKAASPKPGYYFLIVRFDFQDIVLPKTFQVDRKDIVVIDGSYGQMSLMAVDQAASFSAFSPSIN